MITFDGQTLFDSGPARVSVGGLKLRHALQPAPGARGVRVIDQGREGRGITQTGTLTADTIDQLQQQIDAIEAMVHGDTATLVDDLGRTWSNAVMMCFDPKPIARLGVRWKVNYRIEYLQVTL